MLEKLTSLFKNIDLAELSSTYAIPWGINIVMALIIYVVGKMIVRIIINLVKKILVKAKIDEILINFISSIISSILILECHCRRT